MSIIAMVDPLQKACIIMFEGEEGRLCLLKQVHRPHTLWHNGKLCTASTQGPASTKDSRKLTAYAVTAAACIRLIHPLQDRG